MRYAFLLFTFLSINIYAQRDIYFPEVDNISIDKERNDLVRANVKQRITYRQKGDTLGRFKDSHQSILKINQSGRIIKDRNFVILTDNYTTTIYKKNKIKTISRELDCNDRTIGKKTVGYIYRKLKDDSLNKLISVWQDNKIKDTIIIYKVIESNKAGEINYIKEYMVDKKSNCITKNHILPKDSTFHLKLKICKDEHGNTIKKEENTDRGNFLVEYKYDNNNNEIERLEYFNNKLVKITISKYNELNLPTEVSYKFTGKNSIRKNLYSYIFYNH